MTASSYSTYAFVSDWAVTYNDNDDDHDENDNDDCDDNIDYDDCITEYCNVM